MFKLLQYIGIALVSLSFSVVAQTRTDELTSGQFSRIGRHNIELSIGLLSRLSSSNNVSFGNISAESKASAFMGTLSYSYWIEEDLAIRVSSGVLSADANSFLAGSTATAEKGAVVPILFGIEYQPFTMTDNNKLRPIVSAAIGPYIGAASNARVGATTTAESFTETAIGGHIAAGLDFALSSWFTLGASAGYHIVGDFEKRIGSEKNYSGPEFALAIGVIL